jgi:polar amino acid transport system substrate-binding protein
MKARIAALTFAATAMTATSAMAAGSCDATIKVGYTDWPPFQIPQKDGPPKGIDIDIHRALEEIHGCEIKFKKEPWKRTLRGLKKGSTDVANTANKSPEREKYGNFSASYLPYKAVLFQQAGDDRSFESLTDFLDKGNKLSIVIGYDYGDKTNKIVKMDKYADQINEVKNPKLSVRLVAAGRVDGTIGNRYTLGYTARENNVVSKIRATDTIIQSEPVFFMFSKKSVSQDVIDHFNTAIKKLKDQGRIQEIVNKYTSAASS